MSLAYYLLCNSVFAFLLDPHSSSLVLLHSVIGCHQVYALIQFSIGLWYLVFETIGPVMSWYLKFLSSQTGQT